MNILPLRLNIIRTNYFCYILTSSISNRSYVGYTINFPHRIRQHNGELVGGAKKTRKWRPWLPICHIRGFRNSSEALRFEYRVQHPSIRRRAGEDSVAFTLKSVNKVINSGDGSIVKDNKRPWPILTICWFRSGYRIDHQNIINEFTQ